MKARIEPDLAPEEVPYEDVDDIIGIAAKMKQSDTDRLTADELKDVARELGIEEKYVDKAVAKLHQRRRETEQREREDAARKRKLTIGSAIAVGSVVVLFGISSGVVQAGLRPKLADVEQRRAQVKNVIERQKRVEAQYQGRPPGPERDAELSGAENRVRIERRRYDKAAAEYNASAGGPFSSLSARLYGLPTRVPLSNKVTSW